jgi:hypothetical protein
MGRIWMKNYPGLMHGQAAVFRYYAESFSGSANGANGDAFCSYAHPSTPFHPSHAVFGL